MEGKAMSLLSLLTVLFIGLKLTSNIDWPWWLVTLPTWLPFTIYIILQILILIFTTKAERDLDKIRRKYGI
jgi:hypothetical protein